MILGKLFDIPIYLDPTFFLGMLLISFANFLRFETESPLYAFAFALLSFLGLQLSVTCHELGHCFAARRMKEAVISIRLSIFGGVAHLSGMGREPQAQAIIAIAGPSVSLAFVVIFVAFSKILPEGSWLSLVQWLAQINAILLLFNLLPILPLDGGRLLVSAIGGVQSRGRAYIREDFFRATRFAGTIAPLFIFCLGVAFFVIPILRNPINFLVLVYIYKLGRNETTNAEKLLQFAGRALEDLRKVSASIAWASDEQFVSLFLSESDTSVDYLAVPISSGRKYDLKIVALPQVAAKKGLITEEEASLFLTNKLSAQVKDLPVQRDVGYYQSERSLLELLEELPDLTSDSVILVYKKNNLKDVFIIDKIVLDKTKRMFK